MSANMKVKIKAKEQTGFEKRNTSIAVFASVAAIPLLFTLFVGYMLGNTNSQNEENLQERIVDQQTEIESLNNEIAALNQSFLDLGSVFSSADSVFNKLNTQDLKTLEQKMEDAETERDFNRWDNDNDQVKDDFKHDLEGIIKPLDYDQDTPVPAILESAKSWLKKYAESRADELYLMKINKKLSVGLGTSQDLEDKIDELKDKLLLKEIEIKTMAGSGKQESGSIKMDLKGASKELQACHKELADLKAACEKEKEEAAEKYSYVVSQNKEIKEDIERETIAIQEDAISDLRRELFNEKKFDKAKKKLEAKINTISTKAAALITN